jgi:hypothetical protein
LFGTRISCTSLISDAGKVSISGAVLSGGFARAIGSATSIYRGMHFWVPMPQERIKPRERSAIFLWSGTRSPRSQFFPLRQLTGRSNIVMLTRWGSRRNTKFIGKIAFSGTPVNSARIRKFLLALL